MFLVYVRVTFVTYNIKIISNGIIKVYNILNNMYCTYLNNLECFWDVCLLSVYIFNVHDLHPASALQLPGAAQKLNLTDPYYNGVDVSMLNPNMVSVKQYSYVFQINKMATNPRQFLLKSL